jgi:hypothetical protein
MSDYSKTTNFTAKDSLATGDPEKIILGADMDTEFDAIASASATKYDSDNLASQAEAEAETDNTVLMTPLRLANWSDANLGLVGDLQALVTDPAADRIIFFDDTDNTLKFLTVGTNLSISGTTISAPTATLEAALDHDNLVGYLDAEHYDWTQDQGANNLHVNNITEAGVTQHEAALSITQAQVTDISTVSQAEAEAGTATTDRLWTAQRVAQAITALESAGAPGNGCKVHDASTQSISDNTYTAINFDTEAYDTNSYHDNVTNNTRITIPSGVTKVRLTGFVTWPANGSSYRLIKIRKGGSDGAIDDAVLTYQPEVFMSAANGTVPTQGMVIDSGIITVAATDYFELMCYQNSGGPLSLPAYQSWFACEEIA